jgi:hypothetical protein
MVLELNCWTGDAVLVTPQSLRGLLGFRIPG